MRAPRGAADFALLFCLLLLCAIDIVYNPAARNHLILQVTTQVTCRFKTSSVRQVIFDEYIRIKRNLANIIFIYFFFFWEKIFFKGKLPKNKKSFIKIPNIKTGIRIFRLLFQLLHGKYRVHQVENFSEL